MVNRKLVWKQIKGCYVFVFLRFVVYFFKILLLWSEFIRATYIRIFLVSNQFLFALRLLLLSCDGAVRMSGNCEFIDSFLGRNIVFNYSLLYVIVPLSDSFLCTTIPVSDFLSTKLPTLHHFYIYITFLYLHHTSSPLSFPLTENTSVTSSCGITVFYDLGFFQSCVIRMSVFWDETLRRWLRSSRRFERRCRLSLTSSVHRNSANTKLPDVPNWLLRIWMEKIGMISVINLRQIYRFKKLDRPGNVCDYTVNFPFLMSFWEVD